MCQKKTYGTRGVVYVLGFRDDTIRKKIET